MIMLSMVSDPPLLSQNIEQTTKTQISISWTDGNYNGGQTIIDYRLWYDQATNGVDYIIISSTLYVKSYIITGLTAGKTYKFRVEARNSIGYSDYSNELEAIAAIVPVAPGAPSSAMDVNDVIISWSSPSSTS